MPISKPSIIDYFEKNLIDFLQKPADPNGEKNQAANVIDAGKQTLGELSRIFDAFPYPIPTYEELVQIFDQPSGPRQLMQDLVNGLLPQLLNPQRTGLNEKIIEAIGKENYAEILASAQGDAQKVAQQFVKAIFVSYGQRIIDITKNNHDQQMEVFGSINPLLTELAGEVTLKGLPDARQGMQDLDKVLEVVSEFQKLIFEAKEAGITMPRINNILGQLSAARAWVNPDDETTNTKKPATRLQKALKEYDLAVNSFIKEANNIQPTQDKPEQAAWYIRLIRFITRNEKALQSVDELRYERQQELLPQLAALKDKFSPPQVESSNKQVLTFEEWAQMPDIDPEKEVDLADLPTVLIDGKLSTFESYKERYTAQTEPPTPVDDFKQRYTETTHTEPNPPGSETEDDPKAGKSL